MKKEYKQRICIGIVSYLPDNEYREERVRRCKNLIAKCDEIFNLPIVVIAQNWGSEISSQNIIRLDYPKLGITSARKILWEYFRRSGFDWLICFDDDCVLEGSESDGNRLIDFLSQKDDGYLCGKKYEFKLCVFHKKIAFAVDIPNLDVELMTGIEDYGFFRILELKFSDKKIEYDFKTLKETSCWADDKTSNWHRQGLAELIGKTNKYIRNNS